MIFGKGEAAPVRELREYVERPNAFESKIVELLFKVHGDDVRAVATDAFLDKSRDQYGPEWLLREIVQNFVDGNIDNPQTLDGVSVKERMVDRKSGTIRFTIRAPWAIEKPAGLAELHSAKQREASAGGNGIGLKQAVLRYMRDFGVSSFSVKGRGWRLHYGFARAQSLNEKIAAKLPRRTSSMATIDADWLIAKLDNIGWDRKKNSCEYVIETSDPAIIQTLREFHSLGVSAENPHLQKPDFQNEHGSITWLQREKADQQPHGRIYVNGQVMGYEKQYGEEARDYWHGPAFASVVTQGLGRDTYKMSIDRPPLSKWDLQSYVEKNLIPSMSEEDLVDQLHRSKHIWINEVDREYSGDRIGAFIIIEAIVKRLERGSYADFMKDFPVPQKEGRGFLAHGSKITDAQAEQLTSDGYILLPRYFSRIGVPDAASKLDSVDVAAADKPTSPAQVLRETAREHGMHVGYEHLHALSATTLLHTLHSMLPGVRLRIESRTDKPRTFRVFIDMPLDEALLFEALHTFNEQDAAQRALHGIRSIAQSGLENRMFEDVFMSQGEIISTFNQEENAVTGINGLITKHISSKNDLGTFLEFQFSDEADAEAFAATIGNSKGYLVNAAQVVGSTDRELSVLTRDSEPDPSDGTSELTLISAEGAPTNDPYDDDLSRRLGAVPVDQPTPFELTEGPERFVHGELSAHDQIRLQTIEPLIPDIVDRVRELNRIVPDQLPDRDSHRQHAFARQYLDWRDSSEFTGQLGQRAKYLSGSSLLEIVERYEQDGVPVAISTRERSGTETDLAILNLVLTDLANRTAPPIDQVGDFELITTPSPEQLIRLGALREFVYIATGVAIPNDLFVFRGDNAKGINIAKKAIGLHEDILSQPFFVALQTMVHEVAHNNSSGHGEEFLRDIQVLFTRTIETYSRNDQKSEYLKAIANTWGSSTH